MNESSNVDDRTEHEIYTQPFLKSIMAGVASIMCSYSMLRPVLSNAVLVKDIRPYQQYVCMPE